MTSTELWNYFLKNSIATNHPFDRAFVWIHPSDFEPIAEEFIKDRNLLHPGLNFRSKHPWQHIHVIIQESAVHAHLDTGNVALSMIKYGLPHLWYDVFPYAIHSLRHRVSIASWFILPSR
jgi:hypothetical protein